MWFKHKFLSDMGDRLAARYELIEPLGTGGFGQTFLAHDHHLPGQPICVIKQLKPYYQDAKTLETAQRLFELEAQTLYRLGNHDQIPRLLAHFEQAGQFFLVQEYISGQSLAQEFREHPPLTEATTLRLLQDLLQVLAIVHQERVIHRDLKPANIIRRQSDRKLVLIDFGAVKALNGLSPKTLDSESAADSLTIAIGSPGYMPPEQQASRPCFASDLYALAMVALQGLTHQHPKDFSRDPHTDEITCAALRLSLSPHLTTFLDRLAHSHHRARPDHAQAALNLLETLFPVTELEAKTITSNQWQSTYLPTAPIPPVCLPSVHALPVQTPTVLRNRQTLLNKVRHFWIRGVLERSLHNQVLLTLGLEERPDAVAVPWNLTYEIGGDQPRPLPVNTAVIDIFDQMGEGRTLLILGEPGAGKTTTLLSLARDLLVRATQDQMARIPVVFNLSSWQQESLVNWLIKELNSKYQVPKAIGRIWVEEQQLLLLLDGLDEVQLPQRTACIEAINHFHQGYGPEMVVCCRIQDYAALPVKLSFQSALYLRELTESQIWHYLNQANSGLTGLKMLLEQEATLQDQATSLLTLARSPLILSIMALTYQGISPENISPFNPTQDYQYQLFEAYIQRMFQRRQLGVSHYSAVKTRRWLQQLAYEMQKNSQTVFMIERMQPDWLQGKLQKGGYLVGVWIAFFAIATLIGSQVLSPERLMLALIIGGLICSRIFGVNRITPAETLRWSWQKARNNLVLGLLVGPVIGCLLKVGFGLIFANSRCLTDIPCLMEYSFIGATFGATLGLTFGIIRGFSGTRVAVGSIPNQGIWQSARNALLFSLVATITLLLPGLWIANTKASFWAASGLAFGLAAGGGEAVIKHGILRLILWCNGMIPWNYARFLDYATERIFLQKVGGGYIFVHRLLLEHFATLANPK